jgi:hypothetical protein
VLTGREHLVAGEVVDNPRRELKRGLNNEVVRLWPGFRIEFKAVAGYKTSFLCNRTGICLAVEGL